MSGEREAKGREGGEGKKDVALPIRAEKWVR